MRPVLIAPSCRVISLIGFDLRGGSPQSTVCESDLSSVQEELAQLKREEMLLDDYIERMYGMIKEISESPQQSAYVHHIHSTRQAE